MKILYFNAFLCKNGEKTRYPLHRLFDFIISGTPDERTQIVNRGKIISLAKNRSSLARREQGRSVPGYEFINTNRSVWIGKFNDDKPFTGAVGSDEIEQIVGDLYQPNMTLSISDSFLILMEYNFLGPGKRQLEEFLSSYVKDLNSDEAKYDVRLYEIPTDEMSHLIPNSRSIKSVTLTLNNEGFHLGNLFNNLSEDNMSIFRKLFSSPIEASNEMDVNQTTIVLNKGRRRKEMDVDRISEILNLIRVDSDLLASAIVKFEHPTTREVIKMDLKHEGYYTGQIESEDYAGFDFLAELLTTHYYDRNNRAKDTHYTQFDFVDYISEEFELRYPDNNF